MKLLKYSEINKILILRISSMGDCILASHLVRCLRERFPASQIDFLISKQFSEIYKFNPYLNNIIEYDKELNLKEILKFKKELLNSGSQKKYDVVIDLQGNLRSFIFRFGIGRQVFKIKKRRLHKLMLIYFKKSFFRLKLIPDIYFETVKKLGIVDDGKGLEIWNEEENLLKQYLNLSKISIDKNIRIAIAPGAHHFTKRFPAEKFIKLIENLAEKYNSEFVLLGGSKDKEICGFIKNNSKPEIQEKIIDKSGAVSILETAGYLDSCNLLITNDTGVMHIAAARQIPIAAIFGSTVKEFGFEPFRINNMIIEKNIACRPCTHIGRDKCPKGHFNCMEQISIEEMTDSIQKLIFQSQK